MDISFQKLTLADLPLLAEWLNKSHVHEWYDKEKENSLADVEKRYAPKIRGEKPTNCYFALADGTPFGYLQWYKVNDWPEFGDHLGYDDHTAAVDLFIGDEKYLGQGLGAPMLKQFVETVVLVQADISTCLIGPEPDNARAIRVYEKAGFRFVKSVQIPGEAKPTLIMEYDSSHL